MEFDNVVVYACLSTKPHNRSNKISSRVNRASKANRARTKHKSTQTTTTNCVLECVCVCVCVRSTQTGEGAESESSAHTPSREGRTEWNSHSTLHSEHSPAPQCLCYCLDANVELSPSVARNLDNILSLCVCVSKTTKRVLSFSYRSKVIILLLGCW